MKHVIVPADSTAPTSAKPRENFFGVSSGSELNQLLSNAQAALIGTGQRRNMRTVQAACADEPAQILQRLLRRAGICGALGGNVVRVVK